MRATVVAFYLDTKKRERGDGKRLIAGRQAGRIVYKQNANPV